MSTVSTMHAVDPASLNAKVTLSGMTVPKSIQKLIAVGDGTGIALSDEVLTRMGVKCGDSLYLEETSTGVHLMPCHDSIPDQLGLADDIMRENRDALRRLA